MPNEPMPTEQAARVQFRKLTPAEESAVRGVRMQGELIASLLEQTERDVPEIDKRWLAIARTEYQQAQMALVRAIVRPEFF